MIPRPAGAPKVAAVLVLAIILLGFTPPALQQSEATATTSARSPNSPVVPYLNLAVILANSVHSHMLNSTAGAYFYSVTSDWKSIDTPQYSTLGNAMMVYAMLQLYETTDNSTYLQWASSTSEAFLTHGWSSRSGGFLDLYLPNWDNASCDVVLQDNAMFEIDFLTLYAVSGSPVWLQRATGVENLLNSRLWSSSEGVPEVYYDACASAPSGDANVEQSIGSYLWATSLWTQATGNRSYVAAMVSAYNFALRYLWDGTNNSLPAGPGATRCGGPPDLGGYIRSVYLSPLSLEDCTKGANENIWGTVGVASLYSVTGNASILAQVYAGLRFINGTFWDPTNGGYHNDAFQNGTLTSSCASTGDPRDYPGWTEGEQPMFWWYIGNLVNNATVKAWSVAAEQWTAQHQWNTSNSGGGEMACLDSNMVPDAGSTDLFDWIQASTIYGFSAISSVTGTTTTSQGGIVTTSSVVGPPSSSEISTTTTGSSTHSQSSMPSSFTASTSSELTSSLLTNSSAASTSLQPSNLAVLAVDAAVLAILSILASAGVWRTRRKM